jgi:hypothetical protein
MGGAGLYEVVLNERADGLCNEAADFIEQSLTPPVTADTVFEAIKHGDDEHRAWLREACDNLFAGKPAPPPRGTNSLTPPEGALTLDNASIQRLMDYGLLHHTNRGWIVGEWEDAVKADQSPPEGDTVSGEVVERVARRIQLWWMTQKHEPMHQNDAGDLARAAIAALQSRVSPQAGMREALEPFVERLEMLEDNCRKLGCVVPSETNVRTSWLRKLRAALSTDPIPTSEDAK